MWQLQAVKDEKEQAMLDKFRTKVEDLKDDDFTLIRFLRARDHDLDKAEDMLRKNWEWRKEKKISQYLNWKPSSPLFIDHSPAVCTGYDYEGCPVIFIPFGRWQTRKYLEMGLRKDCWDYMYHTLEYVMYHIKNSKGGKLTFIADPSGITYRECTHIETTQMFYKGFEIFEKNYPEILKVALVINAPWLFWAVYRFLRPVFTGSTVSKIQFLNTDRAKYMEELKQIMPEKSIPPAILDQQ